MDTYNVGDELEGKVTKVVTFGAFVEIMEGVEGLVHISELAHHHVENPREVVSQGDTVKVKILEIDSERRRLSLSVKRVEGQDLPLRASAGDGDRQPRSARTLDEVPSSGSPRTCSPSAEAVDERRLAMPKPPRPRPRPRPRPKPPRPRRPRPIAAVEAEAVEAEPEAAEAEPEAEPSPRPTSLPPRRPSPPGRGAQAVDEAAGLLADVGLAPATAALALRRPDRRHRRRQVRGAGGARASWARRRSRPTPWSTSCSRATRCATCWSSASATEVAPGREIDRRPWRSSCSRTRTSASGSRACSGRAWGSAWSSWREERSAGASRRPGARWSRCRCCSRRHRAACSTTRSP